MATAARKARKRAGIKFEKAPKTPTPVMQRSAVIGLVPGAPKTKDAGHLVPRSEKKVARYLESRGVEYKSV